MLRSIARKQTKSYCIRGVSVPRCSVVRRLGNSANSVLWHRVRQPQLIEGKLSNGCRLFSNSGFLLQSSSLVKEINTSKDEIPRLEEVLENRKEQSSFAEEAEADIPELPPLVASQNLDQLIEETQEVVLKRDGRRAFKTHAQWLKLHNSWFRDSAVRSSNDLVKAILVGCNSIHDLLPCMEPRLAPYNYMEPLFDDESGLKDVTSTPKGKRLFEPRKLWETALEVIQVSAQAMQAVHRYLDETHRANRFHDTHLARLSREIPQRSQALLERFQSSPENGNSVKGPIQATDDEIQKAILHVLTSWAYSEEYVRGSRAGAFFKAQLSHLQKGEVPENGKKRYSRLLHDGRIQPELYKMVLRAWCQSNDKNHAFEATRYLHQLQDTFRAKAEHFIQSSLTEQVRQCQQSTPIEELEDVSHDEASGLQSPSVIPMRQVEIPEPVELDASILAYEPSLEDYQLVLRAWSRDESSHATSRAVGILKRLVTLVDDKLTRVRPDTHCYRYLLQTAASTPLLDPSYGAPILQEALREMQERWAAYPDYACYTAAIRSWRNIALHPQNESSDEMRDKAVRQVMDLLEDSQMANKRRYMKDDPLSAVAYNDVLETISVWSATPKEKTNYAERILSEMEGSEDRPKPNPKSYEHVVNVWRSTLPFASKYGEPLARAKTTLWRMMDNVDAATLQRKGKLRKRGVRVKHRNEKAMIEHNILHEANSEGNPVDVLNAYISMCSSTDRYFRNKESEGMLIFREAVSAVDSFRRRKVQPNWATYAALFQAAKKLLPPGEARYKIAKQVFGFACNDGMVEDEVLKSLMAILSEEQYHDMVTSKSIDVEGSLMVPEEWTKVALGGSVLSSDGRRTRPLTVAGELAITMAMREFRMRSLRDKRNQNLLRGGRWVENEGADTNET